MEKWQSEEKYLARRLNGRETRGSGRGNQKGDARSEEYIAEQKMTSKDYFSLKFLLLKKITDEATRSFKQPLFSVTITVRSALKRFHIYRISEEETESKEKSYRITEYSDEVILYTPYGTWEIVELGGCNG